MFNKKIMRKGRPKPVDYANNPAALTALLIDFEVKAHLYKAKNKPPRVLPRRDKQYLIELATGAFRIKQGQIFYNPTERQLDKIFEGELYGYC